MKIIIIINVKFIKRNTKNIYFIKYAKKYDFTKIFIQKECITIAE